MQLTQSSNLPFIGLRIRQIVTNLYGSMVVGQIEINFYILVIIV